jgi:hypothetical protein
VNRSGSPLIYHDGGYASVSPVVRDVPTSLSSRSRSR